MFNTTTLQNKRKTYLLQTVTVHYCKTYIQKLAFQKQLQRHQLYRTCQKKKIKYSFTNVPVHYYFCLIYDAGPLCQRYLKQTPLLNSGLNGNCRRKKCFCQFFRKTRAFGNFYCMSTVANSGNSLQF